VYGPEIQLSQMKSEDIPTYIDVSSLPEGQSIVQPVFELPETIHVKAYYYHPI
jgi:YbbR domain-containing protein